MYENDDLLISRLMQIENQTPKKQSTSHLAKLSYLQVFCQSGQRIVVHELINEKSQSIYNFTHFKQIHEKGVKKFKQQNLVEEEIGRRRKRGYSIHTDITGAYYLNNWISHEDFHCERPQPQDKLAILLYDIFSMKWTKALQTLSYLQKSAQRSTLQYIINGFRLIQNVLSDDQLQSYFINRKNYKISFSDSNQSVGGLTTFVNVLQQDSKQRFNQIPSLPKKVQCLRINLQFLVRFASKFKTSKNSYFHLAYNFLGNQYDQLEDNVQQHDFLSLLLDLDLKLPDRLNFATKLLPQKKRKQFCRKLQQRICTFPRLQNIIFYQGEQHKQQKIQHICKCYLDKYGDLQTIAYLARDFPFLKQYLVEFRQILKMSYEHKDLQRLKNYFGPHNQTYNQIVNFKKLSSNSFFKYLNINDQKFQDWSKKTQEQKICQICSKKMISKQNFFWCGKCQHGGHLQHILKWFQQSSNCAHIGCPCFCN